MTGLYFHGEAVHPNLFYTNLPMKFDGTKLRRVRRTIGLASTCSTSIDQAIGVAVSRIGGLVFDVRIREVNDRTVWRIKLLKSGEEVKVYVDARSGQILQAKARVAVVEPHQEITSAAADMV